MSSDGQGHHVYDDIVEHDNPLPNWWLGIFFLTVVFGYGYWIYYHVAYAAPGQYAELAEEEAQLARKLAATKPVTNELLAALAKDGQSVAAGEKVYVDNCLQCHADRLQGNIGPNLTDEFWLHGGKPVDIYNTVAKGVEGKPMQAWIGKLGPERVRNVTAFVLTKKNTKVAGKEPQGNKVAD